MPVNKILVANRGEIAMRVMRTCRELQIPTVAVYPEEDRKALHVAFADEREELKATSPRAAYLDSPQIIEAAKKHRADAIHPGYGFLSENAKFSAACVEAGIEFIGPSPHSIEAMGDKVAAREAMRNAGVPVVPGTDALPDEKAAADAANRIGYPLLVKASAGGGGIGMRVAAKPEELAGAFEACRRAAQASFGNPAVYLERYLHQPRHIEMQVLADAHGTTLALGERDCSIQRRHQKLIEETPAPGLSEERRAAMAQAAIKAAAAVGYKNAGTVEFIFSKDDFYFLEMNTRLQVEHPITEEVLGIDLVAWQIKIARGDRLPEQGLGKPRGHAIEFRVNAEDPLRNFLPTPRRIQRYVPPTGPGVRVDSGIRPHMDVSSHFDSLLLKLIVRGEDRLEAIARGRRALDEFILRGPSTTIPFHRAVLDESDYVEGKISTHFIEDHPEVLKRAQQFAAQRSPLESLYGGEGTAVAIAAALAATESS